jgi:hypothetical protein
MHRRLFPLAELAAFAGILAGGYTVVAAARATALAESASEPRDKQEIAGEVPARVAARIGAPISTARPPVPLLLSSRSPQGSVNAQPAEMTSDSTVTEQTDKKVASDAAAKAMIEADGYKKARAVAKAPDGSWRGFAMRGAVEVAVSVDDSGNVTTQ